VRARQAANRGFLPSGYGYGFFRHVWGRPEFRALVARCEWLGLAIDPARNSEGTGRLSPDEARAEVWVIPTDEERTIAGHALRLVG
jgi:hypothetical protein